MCREVDLKAFFLDRPDRHGYRPRRDSPTPPHEVVLGPLLDMSQKAAKCALCRIIIKSLEMSWTALPLRTPIRLFQPNPPTICRLKSAEATTTEEPVRSIEIDVFEGTNYIDSAVGAERSFQTELRLLADDADQLGLKRLGHGRVIGDVCDTSLIKAWYRNCVQGHQETCSGSRENTLFASNSSHGENLFPKNMWLVDVHEMRIVPAVDGCKFVALSYVWVDSNRIVLCKKTLKRWQRKKALTTIQLPKTFLDAIDLVKDLEEDYLWIDALCIVQDSDHQTEQMHQMDLIYSSAMLVVVAAAGQNADQGFPGYHETPRSTGQYVETIQGLRVLVSSPSLDYVLKSSKWNSRGWTYQEWKLARRALVVSSSQVYFICNSASYCEDIELEAARAHKAVWLVLEQCEASTTRHYLPSRYMPLTINSGFRDYRQLVQDYSPRTLTRESDVLTAISGIFNILHRASRNRFICGMSVGLLHDALFWVPAGPEPLQRRAPHPDPGGVAYPSWSWAGWKGAVRYNRWPGAESANVEQWHVVSADGKATPLAILGTPLAELQDDHLITHTGTSFFTGQDNNMDSEEERLRQGEGGLPHNFMKPCRLAFMASVAVFRVVTGIDGIDMNDPAEAIVESEGRWIGMVWLDNKRSIKDRMVHNFQWYRFVEIATVTEPVGMKRVDGFSFDNEELCQWLNVLVIKPRDHNLFERLGVAQVRKRGWDNEEEKYKVRDWIMLV